MKFYTYIYLDTRKPGNFVYEEYSFGYEPFYVGEGQNGRMVDHLRNSKKNKKSPTIQKIQSMNKEGFDPLILKIREFEHGDDSLALETKLIKLIGTIVKIEGVKNGPLTNLLIASDGAKKRIFSEEAKKKMSSSSMNKKHTPETKQKISERFKGKPQTKEHAYKRTRVWINKKHKDSSIQLMREKALARPPFSEERRANMGKANKISQSKPWKIQYENGDSEIVNMLTVWCEEKGINYKGLRGSLTSKGFYKGIKLIRIE